MINRKICLVTSSGGHLVMTYYLKGWWLKYDRLWVTRDDEITKSLLKDEQLYFGYFPENRSIINLFRNFLLAWKVLIKEKPGIVFSMGAGIAPPFLLVAKILGIKTIFMETFITIPKPTMSGRLVYPFVDLFLVQHERLLEFYPKAYYWGAVL